MKVLFICDDLWHPAEVLMRGLSSLQKEGYELDFVRTAKDILTPAMLREYPVVVNAKGNAVNAANSEPWFEPTVTEVMPEDFAQYVEEGGGFVALHAGNTYRRDKLKSFCDLIGNSFQGHPLRCPVTVEPVGFHPILDGVEGFAERDEHYQIGDLAEDIDVFLKTKSEPGGTQVAGYTRNIGKGRLCVLTPGHTLAMLQNRNFQRLFMNAVDWCAGKKG